MCPGILLFFLPDLWDKIFFTQLIKAHDRSSDGGWFRRANQAYSFVWYKSRQAANICYDHRFFKMIGEGCYAALGRLPVRLYHYIRGTQVISYFTVRNKMCFPDDLFFYP